MDKFPVFLVTSNLTDLANQMVGALIRIPFLDLIIVDNCSTWPAAIEWREEMAQAFHVYRVPEDLGLDAPWWSGLVRDIDDLFLVVTPLAYSDDVTEMAIADLAQNMKARPLLGASSMCLQRLDGVPAPEDAGDGALGWLPCLYRKLNDPEAPTIQRMVTCRYFPGDPAYDAELRQYRARSVPLGPWPVKS